MSPPLHDDSDFSADPNSWSLEKEIWFVQRLQTGDKVAFTVLFQRYSLAIYRFLRGPLLLNHESAEDFVQETFLAAWTKKCELREPAKFRSWLYQIARHHVYSYERRFRRFLFTKMPEEENNEHPRLEGPENAVSEADTLERALAKLKKQERAAVHLVDDGFDQKEIAEIMGKSEATVSRLITNARDKLRKNIVVLLKNK